VIFSQGDLPIYLKSGKHGSDNGLARVGFPVPRVEGTSVGPRELPICCADTHAIVAIIEYQKTGTPTTTTDPATINSP
jgi:hypothetical protein